MLLTRPVSNLTLHELSMLVASATQELSQRLRPNELAPIRTDDGHLVPGARLATRLQRPGAYKGETALDDVMKDILKPVYSGPGGKVIDKAKVDDAERAWREARELANDYQKSRTDITQAGAVETGLPEIELPPMPKIQRLVCDMCEKDYTIVSSEIPAIHVCPACS